MQSLTAMGGVQTNHNSDRTSEDSFMSSMSNLDSDSDDRDQIRATITNQKNVQGYKQSLQDIKSRDKQQARDRSIQYARVDIVKKTNDGLIVKRRGEQKPQ